MTGSVFRAGWPRRLAGPPVADPLGIDVRDLASGLRQRGVAPAIADRLAVEVAEHLDDLIAELRLSGESESSAREQAAARLGDVDALVASCAAYPELRAWWKRYPRTAACVYPLVYVAALPAAPVIAGFAHRALLARWTACLFASGVVTSSLFWLLTLAVNPS